MALSGGVQFVVTGDEQVAFKFRRGAGKAEDLRTVWRRFSKVIANHNLRQFQSDGMWAGTPWAPLNAQYLARKIAAGFPRNTLMRTMDLYWAAITPGRLLRQHGRNAALYQLDDEKYVHHHFGAPRANLPERPIMVASEKLEGELARLTGAHVVEGFK